MYVTLSATIAEIPDNTTNIYIYIIEYIVEVV